MLYINLDPDFPEHPKARRLDGILGEGSWRFIVLLWCYAAKYHPENGDLSAYSDAEIEGLIRWRGEPGKLVEALVKVGFLDVKRSGKKMLHDWLDHEGHIDKLRRKAQANAKKRWDKIGKDSADSSASSNTDSTEKTASSIASSSAPTYLPNLPTITSDEVIVKAPEAPPAEEDKPEVSWASNFGKQKPYTTGDGVRAVREYLAVLLPDAKPKDLGGVAGKSFDAIRLAAFRFQNRNTLGPPPAWYTEFLKIAIGIPPGLNGDQPSERKLPQSPKEFCQFLFQILKPENGDQLQEYASSAYKALRD